MFRSRPLRPLIAALLSLLLLGAQQAAFAHLIGHLAVGSATVTVTDDAGHNAADTLSHVCTTCVSAAALAGAAPLPSMPALAQAAGSLAPPHVTPLRRVGALVSFYRARAPPAVL
jgi:hypothetical protein